MTDCNFPVHDDTETRNIIAGNLARELIWLSARVSLSDAEIYTIQRPQYRMGFRYCGLEPNRRKAKCMYCHQRVALQLHELFVHASGCTRPPPQETA